MQCKLDADHKQLLIQDVFHGAGHIQCMSHPGYKASPGVSNNIVLQYGYVTQHGQWAMGIVCKAQQLVTLHACYPFGHWTLRVTGPYGSLDLKGDWTLQVLHHEPDVASRDTLSGQASQPLQPP